jgi:hypothetical protein
MGLRRRKNIQLPPDQQSLVVRTADWLRRVTAWVAKGTRKSGACGG